MKSILTLSLLFLASCAPSSLPQFPEEIKFQYVTMVESANTPKGFYNIVENPGDLPPSRIASPLVLCLKFEILSANPYKIKYLQEEPLEKCHLVGGYSPSDFKSLTNWIESVYEWYSDNRKCFNK